MRSLQSLARRGGARAGAADRGSDAGRAAAGTSSGAVAPNSDGGAPAQTAELYPLPAPLNAALRGVYRAEAAIAARVGLPFGLSRAAVAVR
jgi:hypothetical protein